MADIAQYDAERNDIAERLAALLGREEVPDAVWGALDKDGLISAAWREGSGSDEWTELVSEARAHLRASSESPLASNFLPKRTGRRRSRPVAATVELDDYSQCRADTFSEVAATLAERRASVRAFRAEHLGSVETRLSEEDAGAWLNENSEPTEALAHLQVVTKELAGAYRWREKAAEWFILTGDVPFVKPLNAKVRLSSSANVANYLDAPYALPDPHIIVETAEITIVAEPWVDANLVTKAYRDVQRQLLSRDAKGADNRKKHGRTLDAIRFAARHIRQSGRIKWSEITSSWNAEQGDDPGRRYSSRHGLQQAFGKFLRPRYTSPNFASYEREPWQRQRDDAQELVRQRMTERG